MHLWCINNICRLYLSARIYLAQRVRKQKTGVVSNWRFRPSSTSSRYQVTYCSIQKGSTVQQHHCKNIKSYGVNIVDVIIVSNRLLLACYEILKLPGFVSCVESVGITEWQVMIILKLHTQKKKKRNLSQHRNPQHDWVQNRGICPLQLLVVNQTRSILVLLIANIFLSAWLSCTHTWIPEECTTLLYIEPLTLCFMCKIFY